MKKKKKKTVSRKTYHEGIKIYFEKVVIKGEKKVRITDIIVSEIDGLSSYKKKIIFESIRVPSVQK